MEEGKIFKRIVLSVFCLFLLIVLTGEALAIGQEKGMIRREDNVFLDFLFNQTGTIYYKGKLEKNKVPVEWDKLYPAADFSEEKGDSPEVEKFLLDFSNDKINAYKERISGKTERESLFFRMAQKVKGLSEDVMGFNDTYYEFGTVEKAAIKKEANEIVEINNFCREEQIDFLYLNPGTENFGNEKAVDTINNNTDAFIKELAQKDVPAIDMRQVFLENHLTSEQMFFRTNSHWKSTSGLYVANVILEYLNENAKGAIFKTDDLREENFKTGKILPVYTSERYEYYVPVQSDKFHLVIPDKEIDIRGDFEEVFLNQNPEEIFYDIAECYETWTRTNDSVSRTYNETMKSGKKLLLISDSFSWCVTPYLSIATKEVDTIYLPEFNGSVRNYIAQTNPDAVVFSYTPKRIGNDLFFEMK